MSDEELDRARGEEAVRIWTYEVEDTNLVSAPQIAARLAREGWTPPDPLEVEAKEILVRNHWSNPLAVALLVQALERGIEIGRATATARGD